MVKNTLAVEELQEAWFDPWVGKIPWRRAWQLTPVSCLENPMDGGTWWAIVQGVANSWTHLVNPFLCLLQLLEVAHIPWLVVPSLFSKPAE